MFSIKDLNYCIKVVFTNIRNDLIRRTGIGSPGMSYGVISKFPL